MTSTGEIVCQGAVESIRLLPQNRRQNNGLQGITFNPLGTHNGLLGHCPRGTE